MLRYELLHPDILAALGRAGHGAKILIADGNYPASVMRGPGARLVSLNLAPGIVTCRQVLDALLGAVPVEAAFLMDYPREGSGALARDPVAWKEFQDSFARAGVKIEPERLGRWDFYRYVATPEHVLTVQTADQAVYANLLLTIGVRAE